MDERKQGKINVELKQNLKGVWYASSLNINADTLEEFDKLLLEASRKLKDHIGQLNAGQIKQESKQPETIMDSDSLKIFHNLKELRHALARREGNPPYAIFNDAILRRLAKERPRTDQDVENVLGKKVFNKYGGLVIEVLDRHRTIF